MPPAYPFPSMPALCCLSSPLQFRHPQENINSIYSTIRVVGFLELYQVNLLGESFHRRISDVQIK